MGGLQSGGGTSAVAASAHAGCERFRFTDPFITGKTRRATAEHLGFPDNSAAIPEARWMRAVTFESLVHGDRFVSEILTRTVGRLGLARPETVGRRDCGGTVVGTHAALISAHLAAANRQATMLTRLAVPFVHLEDEPGATPVQPDFAIVCPRSPGSWLIMGDAKDYERIRSRIDDKRMLKGFLQVALGAESANWWSKLPDGMKVHRYGSLAVPRNAFLQPEAVVENLDDHRAEVRARADERLAARAKLGDGRPTDDELAEFVAHRTAAYDPHGCVTCSLFVYCRAELRASSDPIALLTEIGIERHYRSAVAPIVDGGEAGQAPKVITDQVRATVTGLPQWTSRRRTDACGLPGTVNVVLAKSDSAALGVHGVAVQRVGGPWVRQVFAEPQSPLTRRALMRLVGDAIRGAGSATVQLVVPDRPTADLLATAADSLAGVELSRLRWERDLELGRPALTFDGEPASVPEPLHPDERLAVSFLLEEDRARAMSLRTPIVDLRQVLAAHVTAGGPAMDSGRLDYLVTWAEAQNPVEHREIVDQIAGRDETPGARLSNAMSDALHRARRDDPTGYERLVNAALGYRIDVVERAIAALERVASSRLRDVHRALETDAQEVWGRRRALEASDLVRFSRTYEHWRNAQVELLDADRKCADQLACLSDYGVAHDRAVDAGVREVARAIVMEVQPLRLTVQSRRLVAGSRVVALHINGQSLVEQASTTLKIQKGSFKFGQMAVGLLEETAEAGVLEWNSRVSPSVAVGDEIVIADVAWFGKTFSSGHEIEVKRPAQDKKAAPKDGCGPDSFAADPGEHRWCCRPHAVAEAEWSDLLAIRRSRGELNPDTWPPLVDEERFDVGGVPAPSVPATAAPDGLTLDNLD
ncbi:hypothetical protein [Pseudonocardia sediminis]|nr:hypothetical protein [Pseudonocardia sediminis]